MKASLFVNQSIKAMSNFNRKKQIKTVGMISLANRPKVEIDEYEKTTHRRGRKIYSIGDRRRERR